MISIDTGSIVDAYIEDIQSGRRVAGKLEIDSVRRYLEDRGSEGSSDFRYRFDERAAASACQFFPLLQHTDGEYAGRPFILYPWQAFIVWNLFGWHRKDDDLRRFREAFISVARGNGKTPFGAALMLLLFAFDQPIEDRAEVYTAATKRGQADLSFSAAKRFVERSGLDRLVQVQKYNLMHRMNGSKLEPLSSDGKSADGLNIHGLLKDELHAWTNYHREFLEKLDTALGKRRQPMAVTITTAGSEESELWREQYEFCRRVVDRETKFPADHLFVYIAEIDDTDDHFDEACWPKANPMLEFGVVKADHIRQLAAKAKSDPTFEGMLRRYHCNKLTYSQCKSFTGDMWQMGNQPLPDLRGRICHAGVDLGWTDDMAAIGYCWALDEVSINGSMKRRYAIAVDAFIPKGTKREILREPWRTWIRLGLLSVTDSEWTDPQAMYTALKSRRDAGGIKTLAYDPNNAREFALNCTNELGIETFGFWQRPHKYNEPLKEFKLALNEGRILHGGNDLLTWAALNVVEHEDHQGNRMPAKARSLDKIDPFVAVLMAFSEAMFAERSKPSVYERRGPIMI